MTDPMMETGFIDRRVSTVVFHLALEELTNCCTNGNEARNSELTFQQEDRNGNLDQVGPDIVSGSPPCVDPLNVGTHQGQGCGRVRGRDTDICSPVVEH